MVDLSHWDFAEHFSGYDAAALILGLEPRESELEQHRVYVVTDRMELHYNYALERIRFEEVDPDQRSGDDPEAAPRVELESVKLSHLHRQAWLYGADSPLSKWLSFQKQIQFENQEFERYAIACWLTAINMKSAYQFDRRKDAATPTLDVQPGTDIDPTDLPIELDAANMAFRAVRNGYGGRSDTFKNKLIAYLEKHYPDFKAEQVQRVATVANPDKSVGRKKNGKE